MGRESHKLNRNILLPGRGKFRKKKPGRKSKRKWNDIKKKTYGGWRITGQ